MSPTFANTPLNLAIQIKKLIKMKQQTTLLLIVFLLLGWNVTYSQDSNRSQEKRPTPGYIPVFDSSLDLKDSEMYYDVFLNDTLLNISTHPAKLTKKLLLEGEKNSMNLYTSSSTAVLDINHERPGEKARLLNIMRLQAHNGNVRVGIGTPNPAATLDIAGKTRTNEFAMSYSAKQGDILLSDDSEGTARWKDPSVIRHWEETGSSQIVYAPGRHGTPGDVGINMLDPQYALDVNGTIHATDSITSAQVNSQRGLFTGNLSANTGNFSGDVEMNSHVKANELEVINNAQFNSNVTVDGNLSANTGDFSGTLSAGTLSANTGEFAGTVVMDNLKTNADNTLEIRKNNGTPFIKFETDLVSIGHRYHGPMDLKVNGKIYAEEIEVVQDVWSDYVFTEDYELRSLASLESYIRNHKKLPGIPGEEEVKEEGINVSEMNAKLLEKIEELTLYTLEQQKTIKQQKKYIEQQQEQLNQLIEEFKALKNEK